MTYFRDSTDPAYREYCISETRQIRPIESIVQKLLVFKNAFPNKTVIEL